MAWVLSKNGKINKRNPYGQVISDLVNQALAALNEGAAKPTARSERFKVAVVAVPATAHTPASLRLARLVTNEDPLVACALAMGAAKIAAPSVELTGTSIPLTWRDDATS